MLKAELLIQHYGLLGLRVGPRILWGLDHAALLRAMQRCEYNCVISILYLFRLLCDFYYSLKSV